MPHVELIFHFFISDHVNYEKIITFFLSICLRMKRVEKMATAVGIACIIKEGKVNGGRL